MPPSAVINDGYNRQIVSLRQIVTTNINHSLANWDSCPTPAKSEGIEYLQIWPHRK